MWLRLNGSDWKGLQHDPQTRYALTGDPDYNTLVDHSGKLMKMWATIGSCEQNKIAHDT